MNTRRYGLLPGPSSSSCGRLRPRFVVVLLAFYAVKSIFVLRCNSSKNFQESWQIKIEKIPPKKHLKSRGRSEHRETLPFVVLILFSWKNYVFYLVLTSAHFCQLVTACVCLCALVSTFVRLCALVSACDNLFTLVPAFVPVCLVVSTCVHFLGLRLAADDSKKREWAIHCTSTVNCTNIIKYITRKIHLLKSTKGLHSTNTHPTIKTPYALQWYCTLQINYILRKGNTLWTLYRTTFDASNTKKPTPHLIWII